MTREVLLIRSRRGGETASKPNRTKSENSFWRVGQRKGRPPHRMRRGRGQSSPGSEEPKAHMEEDVSQITLELL